MDARCAETLTSAGNDIAKKRLLTVPCNYYVSLNLFFNFLGGTGLVKTVAVAKCHDELFAAAVG